MIDLDDLDELFDDLGFDEPTQDQFTEMLSVFTEDFITNAFQIDGRNVKVVTQPSRNREFRGHPETFVHLITRESKFKGKKERQFDRQRANRIHWVKQILIQRADNRIKYYEWTDERGYLKQHYWFEEGDFLVVLKPISADLLVVTGFYVDALERANKEKDIMIIEGYKNKNRISMNAVRIYGSAGNQVLYPLGNDNAMLYI